jgi:CRISPR-associated exonuclease Cas4
VYSDVGAWEKVEKPLYSKRYGLAGKPDYIVEHPGTARHSSPRSSKTLSGANGAAEWGGRWNGAVIPVEVKPTRVSPQPRESDVMQLAAYALLVEESRGTRVPHGLLKYRDRVFQIEFTAELRARLMALLDEMRENATAVGVARSHTEPRRCRACGYRAECGEELS